MISIDLHGMTLEEVELTLEKRLDNAYQHGEEVIRIIHGQGKHSEFFPVIKSYVRHWLEESAFANEKISQIFRGEDGSPYTSSNPGETVIVFNNAVLAVPPISWEDEEEQDAKKFAKGFRAEKKHSQRRKKHY